MIWDETPRVEQGRWPRDVVTGNIAELNRTLVQSSLFLSTVMFLLNHSLGVKRISPTFTVFCPRQNVYSLHS
jgi:hypothetical protein